MAEVQALGAAHIEPVRRIASRVKESPAAGRYFAIGSSPEMRERVERALAAHLGDPRKVVSLDVSRIEADPWNWLRAQQLEHASDTRGVLYAVHGLGALVRGAEAAGRPNPYAQLNLARDAWGSTGTHLLLWIDGLEEFDRFLHAAPDLWSHRDVVAWFLTRADFVDPSVDEVRLHDEQEPRVAAAERTLADQGASDEERIWAAAALAEARVERAEPLAAWEALMREDAMVRRHIRHNMSDACWDFEGAKCNALLHLGRAFGAAEIAGRLLASERGRPGWWREELRHDVARAHIGARPEVAIPIFEAELSSDRPEFRVDVTGNLVLALAYCGQVRRGTEVNALQPTQEPEQAAWVWSRMAQLAEASGDFATALSGSFRAERVFAATGRRRVSDSHLVSSGFILDSWGNALEADRLFRGAMVGDVAGALKAHTHAWYASWRRSSATGPVPLVSATTQLRSHPIARAVPAEVLHDLLDRLDDDIEPGDPLLPTLEAVAGELVTHARSDSDKEVEGAARWALARLALLRGDPKGAYRLADKVLIPWCRHWRGLIAETDIWRLLALAAPDASTARAHVGRALHAADTSPSIFVQIRARQTAARVEVRDGDAGAAVRALEEAMRLARNEGLRLQELALLHDLSELPGNPGARAAASDALALANVLMLPRDEARALLNLALIARGAGDRVSPRRLERASEIVEELGPPRLRSRVRTALNAQESRGHEVC